MLLAALVAGGLLSMTAQAGARENQLAGIKLGGPSEQVPRLYGDPTRMMTGAPAASAGGGMMGQPGGGPGGPEMGMPGGMGTPPGGMPGGMPGAPGMEGGMGMAPGAAAATAALARQKYEGKIAAMKPEEFVARLLAPPAAAAPAGGDSSGMAMGPGMGMPGMEGGMPGMPGMGMPGMPGAAPAAGQEATPPAITWVYEKPTNPADCVTFVFGFNEDGRVSLIVVGDDKPYSTTRGGRKPPFQGAKTARGIGLGDSFKNVIIAYGFPEATEILGDEVLVKYFERHGVAFTFRQNFMKVTSITVKSPDE